MDAPSMLILAPDENPATVRRWLSDWRVESSEVDVPMNPIPRRAFVLYDRSIPASLVKPDVEQGTLVDVVSAALAVRMDCRVMGVQNGGDAWVIWEVDGTVVSEDCDFEMPGAPRALDAFLGHDRLVAGFVDLYEWGNTRVRVEAGWVGASDGSIAGQLRSRILIPGALAGIGTAVLGAIQLSEQLLGTGAPGGWLATVGVALAALGYLYKTAPESGESVAQRNGAWAVIACCIAAGAALMAAASLGGGFIPGTAGIAFLGGAMLLVFYRIVG